MKYYLYLVAVCFWLGGQSCTTMQEDEIDFTIDIVGEYQGNYVHEWGFGTIQDSTAIATVSRLTNTKISIVFQSASGVAYAPVDGREGRMVQLWDAFKLLDPDGEKIFFSVGELTNGTDLFVRDGMFGEIGFLSFRGEKL